MPVEPNELLHLITQRYSKTLHFSVFEFKLSLHLLFASDQHIVEFDNKLVSREMVKSKLEWRASVCAVGLQSAFAMREYYHMIASVEIFTRKVFQSHRKWFW